MMRAHQSNALGLPEFPGIPSIYHVAKTQQKWRKSPETAKIVLPNPRR